ncbi:protein MCM10 homolog [Saccostrea echinata]|uniref:protein MCM10 homolog n=1 Tax=Saccostrea echinata TaxID=191078 RepID=UPI002A83F1D0|nr:protein MCM10 homolog [Saccostrea echinata]
MSDDECELDALVSLLDDNSDAGGVEELQLSSNELEGDAPAPDSPKEEEGNGAKTTENPVEEECDIDTLTENPVEEECEIDTLTAFLEEEDSEFEEEEFGKNSPEKSVVDSKSVPTVECDVSKAGGDSSGPQSASEEEEEEDNSDIQAELLNIQKKMLELQSQLKMKKKKKKTPKSPSSIVPKTTENGETDPPSITHMKKQSSSDKQGQKSSPQMSKQKNVTQKQKTSDQHCTKKSPKSKEGNSHQKLKETLKNRERKNDKNAGKVVSPKNDLGVKVPNKKKELTTDQDLGRNPFFAEDKNPDPGDPNGGTAGLFGDSDSDWDELDGEVKSGLSESGQVIRDLMKRENGQRVSHASQGDVQELRQRALKSNSWKNRPFAGQEMVDPPRKKASDDYMSITDSFSGIRIINPKISSMEMKYKMADRTLIKLSKIHLKLKSADLQGNWVTIGVIVHKTEPRTSATGKSFCIWRMSDLEDCDRTISFFLFGEVFKQHWKNEVKSVVGILNPHKMDKADKSQQDMAFTVNHPNQILIMGYSQDVGKCAGASKAGKPCTNFINRQQGEFCVYHVQSAYKKVSAKRTELQGSSQVTPKNRMFGPRNTKESLFFYGGETFTNTKRKSTLKDQVSLKNLQASQLQHKGKFTTLSLHNLDPEDIDKLKQLNQKKNDFVELLSTPTVGSLNIVKHLVKKENRTEPEFSEDKKVEIQSISPAELLKQHKLDMIRKKRAKQTGVSSLGSQASPTATAPQLGRGGLSDGFISLDMTSKSKPISSKELAKMVAVSKIKKSGGIQKDDPNSLKRKRESPKVKEMIQERVLSNLGSNGNEDKIPEEPPKKRSKLLGNIDENSEDFKKLMKSKSKHTGALAEVEQEQEERYFMELEKKEKYEDKMQSTMSVKCTVFTCKNCGYTAFKLADRCKTERHIITKSETSKRFFKCKHCGKRKISIQKYPTEPCDCGEYNFLRTAMMEERKGPKLPSENLSLRGDEVAYLGSMNQKVYLDI